MPVERRLAAVFAVAALAACVPGPKAGTGLHLPDGDWEAGQAAFVELRCNACHQVAGADVGTPVATPPVLLRLGGPVPKPWTDGQLLTAILNPSHRISRGQLGGVVNAGALSRMGDYSDTMTARQLIDLVAFLQRQYEFVPQIPAY